MAPAWVSTRWIFFFFRRCLRMQWQVATLLCRQVVQHGLPSSFRNPWYLGKLPTSAEVTFSKGRNYSRGILNSGLGIAWCALCACCVVLVVFLLSSKHLRCKQVTSSGLCSQAWFFSRFVDVDGRNPAFTSWYGKHIYSHTSYLRDFIYLNCIMVLSQGTIGCTPNNVSMVFIVFNLGILGDNLPINTHYIGLI